MIIKYPLSTEKSIRLMESENKLVFVVNDKTKENRKVTKQDIKKEIEETFNVKVDKVTTMYDPKGRKKAFVKFAKENPAIDLATKLGLM